MTPRVQWLALLVMLLAGITIGQFLHIQRSEKSFEDLRAELRLELDRDDAAAGSAG
jgi:hypothetical protein